MQNAFEAERRLIGQGKVAKVFFWNGYAYKCFQPGYRQDWIDYEYRIQRVVEGKGLPVARFYPSEFANSIKMDYVDGVSLADRMRRDKYARGLDDLLALFDSIHEKTGEGLPPIKPELRAAIARAPLASGVKERADGCLAALPDGDALCHLDFHFLNILFSRGEYVVIDWVSAKSGAPLYDFARTYVVLYEFAFRLSGKFQKMALARLGCGEDAWKQAVYVMAAHRISEFDSPKPRQLLAALA